MSVNKVILLGRLGQDPELKYTQNSTAVCNLSVATTYKSKDKETTEWTRVVSFGKTAELCSQYLSKGRQAYVEGRLQTRSWEDKDGNKKYATEVIADKVQFIGGKEDAPNNTNQGNYQQPAQANFATDDVPF